MSSTGRRNLGVLLTAVAAALCAGHYFLWMKPEAARLAEAVRVAQEPAKRKAELDKQIGDLNARQLAFQKQADGYDRDMAALLTQRQRFPRLLEILSTEQSEDLILGQIDNVNGEPRVTGLCLKAGAADQLASALERACREQKLLWTVHPATKQAMGLRLDGGPWSFTVQLQEASRASGAAGAGGKTPANPVRR
jgi:hypothetical protein